MKIVLTTLNAKFTHHNLALRYLRAYCQSDFPNLVVKEYNINQQLALIQSELMDESPSVLGFSCYIWNIEQTLEIVSNIKKISPKTVIILGGPEVSYEFEPLMLAYPEVDYIIAGEGEKPFHQMLTLLKSTMSPSRQQLESVPALVYRWDNQLYANPTITMDLAEIPSPYQDHLDELKHKIVYYETSRGCPFGCEYCLSSRSGRVRNFPLEGVKADLTKLASLGIEQIRFVDRTFNCDSKRAFELLEFMINLDTKTRFQLEIGGDILKPEIFKLLEKAPYNRLQFEIGVQSTNPPTLAEINRTTNLEKLAINCQKLAKDTHVRFLLDLIAGLPLESFARFGQSFDFVYHLQPTKIQLGFLKLLKGSRLRERVEEFGCIFTEKAPYEVLATDQISYSELTFLKVIDNLVDSFYNSGRFRYSLEYLLAREQLQPFKLFSRLAELWKKHEYHMVSHSVFNLYALLWELLGEDDPVLLSYLRFDFRANELKRATPPWMGGSQNQKLARQMIRDQSIFNYLPELKSLNLTPRELSQHFAIEEFDYQIYPWNAKPQLEKQIICFDYSAFPQIKVYDVDES